MNNKAWINYFVDLGLVVGFVVCGITGIIKWPGLLKAFEVSRASIPISNITTMHDYSGALILMLAIVHVWLHLGWMISMTKRLFKR